MVMKIREIVTSLSSQIEKAAARQVQINFDSSKNVNVAQKSSEESLVDEKIDKGQSRKALIDAYIENGVMEEHKPLFKPSYFVLIADGEKTYAEIKEELGLGDGVLRKNNPEIFKHINGYADSTIPKKGTEIIIPVSEILAKEVEFKDDNGNVIPGFYEDYDGNLFYKIQEGDTKTSIYNKLGSESFKYYDIADVLDTYPEYPLKIDSTVLIPAKGFLARIWTDIFG